MVVKCGECDLVIPEKHRETSTQTTILSGRPNAKEEIVTGYDCPNCGHHESW